MGERHTLLELLVGFAGAAVEHGVDAAGVFFLGGEGFGSQCQFLANFLFNFLI